MKSAFHVAPRLPIDLLQPLPHSIRFTHRVVVGGTFRGPIIYLTTAAYANNASTVEAPSNHRTWSNFRPELKVGLENDRPVTCLLTHGAPKNTSRGGSCARWLHFISYSREICLHLSRRRERSPSFPLHGSGVVVARFPRSVREGHSIRGCTIAVIVIIICER